MFSFDGRILIHYKGDVFDMKERSSIVQRSVLHPYTGTRGFERRGFTNNLQSFVCV